jgi:hypothetical protein
VDAGARVQAGQVLMRLTRRYRLQARRCDTGCEARRTLPRAAQ